MPPDDLPRSPTGRIPRWVVDDLSQPRVAAPLWREHPTATASARTPYGTVPYGPVVYPGASAPRGTADRRRARRAPRSGPAVRPVFTAALVLSVVAAVGIAGLSPERGEALGRSVQEWTRIAQGTPPLPPATERSFPAPGVGELPTRLAPAVVAGGPGSPVPGAGGLGYAFIDTRTTADGTDVPVTWSPCRPIHYVVDPTGAPPEFPAEVAAVAAEVAAATGLVFADDGLTTEAAASHREPFQPAVYGDRWAPVLIRFADETTVPDLVGSVAGVATTPTAMDPATGIWHYVSGSVYLDTDLLAVPHTAQGPVYRSILRHELGHLVGLAHVEDAAQVMHPVDQGLSTFQPGDLAGLAELGRGPCTDGL